MNIIEYHLFRIKFIASKQLSLIEKSTPSPRELFRLALEAKPSIKSKSTLVWHIGNVQMFDEESGCFAIGRTTNATLEKYDLRTQDFVEEAFDASPYTYCVHNLELGLVAIARKSKLASTTIGIANRLTELLSSALPIRMHEVSVLVDPIYDPENFLRKIMSAHLVLKFKASFTGPNPFDADELFQKPLSVYCRSANGSRGTAEVEGPALDKDVVSSVARSTAATGNDASARIMARAGGPSKRIQLKGDQVGKTYATDDHDRRHVAADMRAEYRRVRQQ